MSPEITHKLMGFEVLILGDILQYMVFASLTLYPLMTTTVAIWPN